jgi:hypothetical protein
MGDGRWEMETNRPYALARPGRPSGLFRLRLRALPRTLRVCPSPTAKAGSVGPRLALHPILASPIPDSRERIGWQEMRKAMFYLNPNGDIRRIRLLPSGASGGHALPFDFLIDQVGHGCRTRRRDPGSIQKQYVVHYGLFRRRNVRRGKIATEASLSRMRP